MQTSNEPKISTPEKETAARASRLAVGQAQKTCMQIVQVFLDWIADGTLQYGERLYNENELFTMFHVSRPTFREALRVMEALGMVDVAPRKGIRITSPDENRGYLPLLYIMMFEKTTALELFEMRRMLQIEMAEAGALRRTEQQLEELKQCTKNMRDNIDSSAEVFAYLDYEYHMAIIKCGQNRLCLKLMQTFDALLREQLTERIRNMKKSREITLYFHEGICRCIENHDSVNARQMMLRHLEDAYKLATNEPINLRIQDAQINIGR